MTDADNLMSNFGQTLFGGTRFVRWSLSPFILSFAIGMPFLIQNWTSQGILVTVGMEVLCLSLLAGFWLPARFGHGAFRVVGALVFLLFASYVIHEFMVANSRVARHGHSNWSHIFQALAGFIVVGLPCLWYALKGRFTRLPALSAEDLAAENRAFEAQLLNPDWEFFERHLQRPVPAALRELYADYGLVTAVGFEYSSRRGISSFNPLRAEAMVDARNFLGFEMVPIATSDCGDPIYLRPGAAEADTVYITYHDDHKTEIFAESVAVMLEGLRQANYGAYPPQETASQP